MTKRHPASSHPGSDPIQIGALRPPFAPRDEASRWFFSLHRLGIRPGLDSIRELLRRMDHPEQGFEAVVIAGTNGKGSAALILDAFARSAGLRTGLYTSPHLLDLRERVRVDGEMIGTEVFAGLVQEFRTLIDECQTTFFESLTALALEWYRREGVTLAVLETGLGGRLDATNVVRKAGLVLTSVGMDHMELLGHSLEAIAREKLGLAAPSVPFYLDDLSEELRILAVESVLAAGGEPVWMDDLPAPAVESTSRAQGRIQQRQIGRMLAVYRDLAQRHHWPAADAAHALAQLDLAGRYDVRGLQPKLILDTAHNAHALHRVLEQFVLEGRRADRVVVFGSVHGKEIDSVLPQLVRSCGTLIVCAPDWDRALAPAGLAERVRAVADPEATIEVASSVRTALERARSLGPEGVVLVTGSNFLVGEALDRLGLDRLEDASTLWDHGSPLRQRAAKVDS